MRRNFRSPVLVLTLACLAGVAANAQAAKPAPPMAATKADPPAAKPAAPQYTLGAGDVVAVDVWHEPEVSRTLPIRPDGRISLPLAGEILAKGRTTLEL